MATKSKRGGSRPGAGRKAKAAPTPAELEAARVLLAGNSVDDLMELSVRLAAYQGRWDEVSKRGARLQGARARLPTPAGVKQQRQAAAQTLGQSSRFATPPPPKPN